MLKKVLLATDLKERSFCEVKALGKFPPKKVGEVLLLHVLDERKGVSSLDRENEEKLKSQVKELQDRGFNVGVCVEKGIPFYTIVEKVNEFKASLLIMSRGEREFQTKFLGETAYRVLEECPVPMFLCKSKEDGSFEEPLEHVMIGIDFSDHSYNAFRLLEGLVQEVEGALKRVTILHVHERSNIELLEKVVAKGRIQEIIELELSRLEEMAEALRNKGVKDVEVSMRTGRVVDEFISEAEEKKPTLIIVGAQGVGRSEMFRVGSCAFRVSHRAPANVLVVPLGRSWEMPF
ncbi:UspA domain-containing protein [Thermovirga lienii DSM 17291]|uniref:UspA domain-containing protein n=1 Tax=Thermovirga lienii (strain ATCC BAA-1197 / DSM 17291 / Cas60314) TaxID=580340 RepID=G7V8N2_THELD|nr:universal stress protein [Thermovirga lienii]AER67493.1 UspA domain-containing protein [Thermovirga lienii DSM 17291]